MMHHSLACVAPVAHHYRRNRQRCRKKSEQVSCNFRNRLVLMRFNQVACRKMISTGRPVRQNLSSLFAPTSIYWLRYYTNPGKMIPFSFECLTLFLATLISQLWPYAKRTIRADNATKLFQWSLKTISFPSLIVSVCVSVCAHASHSFQ